MAGRSNLLLVLGGLLMPLGLWYCLVSGPREQAQEQGRAESAGGVPVEQQEVVDSSVAAPLRPAPTPEPSRQVLGAEAAARASDPGSALSAWESRCPRILARMVDAQGQPLRNQSLKLLLQQSAAPSKPIPLARGLTDDAGVVEFRLLRQSVFNLSGIPLIEGHDTAAFAFAPGVLSIQAGINDLGTLSFVEESQRESEPLLRVWVVDHAGQPVRDISAKLHAGEAQGGTTADRPKTANSEILLASLRKDRRQLRTGADGALEVYGAPGEPVTLAVQSQGYRNHRGTYLVPQGSLRIVLERRQWLRGSVLLDAELHADARFVVCPGIAGREDPWSEDSSEANLVTAAEPQFHLELGPEAAELLIRDTCSSALLYRRPLDLLPGKDLDVGTIDLRGRIRQVHVRFQMQPHLRGKMFSLFTRWAENPQHVRAPQATVRFQSVFILSGEADWLGYVPSEGARLEIWLLLGSGLAKWRSFDALTLPGPLVVPDRVDPDELTEVVPFEQATIVSRGVAMIECKIGPPEED